MSDRLEDLLARTRPAPTALDPAHRAAVLAGARQAWFRQRARSRAGWIATAAAACLFAGSSGWMLRAMLDEPAHRDPQAMVATAEAARQDVSAREGTARPASPAPTPAAAPMAAPMAAPATAPAAAPSRHDEPEAGDAAAGASAALAAEPAAPAPGAGSVAERSAPGPIAPIAVRSRRSEADAAPPPAAAEAKVASEAAAVLAGAPPANGREQVLRARRLIAETVLHAVAGGRLVGEDRRLALQAALDGLQGGDPADEALRRRLRAALAAP